jgi:hypothetical protein
MPNCAKCGAFVSASSAKETVLGIKQAFRLARMKGPKGWERHQRPLCKKCQVEIRTAMLE